MPHQLADEMRIALDDPYVRGCVTEAVRRRVPGDDVSDVAQAVFCDALSSETGPATATEIRYWLLGVARHAAADYFRKRPREVSSGEGEEGDRDDGISLPPTFEVREAIARVLETLGEGAKKTLFWMVLEHEGVELQSIAKDEKMSPSAVRARVYRLRRTLRKELAYLLCAALAFGGGAEALHAGWLDTVGVVAPVAPSLPDWALGTLVVSRVEVPGDVDAATRSLLRSLDGAMVMVEGGSVHVGPFTLAAEVSGSGNGESLVTLSGAKGGAVTATVEHTREGVTLSSTSGPVRGRIFLRRLR